jgi:hypothetical protein
MSILHADNFSIYGVTSALMLNGIYAENLGCDLVADPDGVSTGKVLRPGWDHFNNSNTTWRYVLQTGVAPIVGIAGRIWNTTLPINNGTAVRFYEWRNIANDPLGALAVLSTGALRFITYAADGTPTNYDTPVPVVTAQGWYHIEAKFAHTGAGTFTYEVRVEGVTVLTGNAVTVRNFDIAQCAAFHVEIGGGAQQNYLKDLVIWNGAGATNNNFLGSVLVTNLLPASDVALNWGLTGGANGYGILDNIPPDDAKFIYARHDVPPAGPYVGTLTDLPVDTTSVKAVITFVRAAKTDGGDGSLQVGVISNGDTGLGSDRPITIAQTYWRDVFELDPDTGAAWLPAAVNAAEIQIDRTT